MPKPIFNQERCKGCELCFSAAVKIVSPDSLLSCFTKKFAAKPAILASNTAAFQQGYTCVAKHTP